MKKGSIISSIIIGALMIVIIFLLIIIGTEIIGGFSGPAEGSTVNLENEVREHEINEAIYNNSLINEGSKYEEK